MNSKMILNTKNIKRTSFVLILILGFGVGFGLRGLGTALSYGVGFLGFCGVALSLYRSSRLRSFSQNIGGIGDLREDVGLKESEGETEECGEGSRRDGGMAQRFSLGVGISFGFARIFAYSVLILALIALMESKLFDAIGVFFGIFLGLCAWIFCFLL